MCTAAAVHSPYTIQAGTDSALTLQRQLLKLCSSTKGYKQRSQGQATAQVASDHTEMSSHQLLCRRFPYLLLQISVTCYVILSGCLPPSSNAGTCGLLPTARGPQAQGTATPGQMWCHQVPQDSHIPTMYHESELASQFRTAPSQGLSGSRWAPMPCM